jgi:TonB family protein
MLWAWTSLLIRSGLILGAAEFLRRCSREKWGPAYRHYIIASGFGLLLVWPALSAVLPAISFPVWQHHGEATVTVTQTLHSITRVAPAATHTNWPLLLWALGVVLSLFPICAGYVRVWNLLAAASPIKDDPWQDVLSQECERLRLVRRPALLVIRSEVVPLTFGVLRPRILLPAGCLEWDESRRRMVLLHELMHIRRHDLAWQIFANMVTALWWFQPLCWLNRRSLRQESEKACDEWVLHSGIRASEYASQLLSFLQRFDSSRSAFPLTTAIVRRGGDLEGRFRAILNSSRTTGTNRPARVYAKLSPRTRAFLFFEVLLLIALTISASAVTIFSNESDFQGGHVMKRTIISGLLVSAGLTAATIGGSVFDPEGAAISDAHAFLYNATTGVKQELTTTPDGKFVFQSLPAGSYILHIQKPGFASLYREFTVKPDSDVQHSLVLDSASPTAADAAVQQMSNDAAPLTQKVRAGNSGTAVQDTAAQAIRVGGEFEQAKLINKVQPVYPASAKAAGIQGRVTLDVTISPDGVPEDIRVLSSPNDDLTQSALEAVSQWRYSSTLLNGQPVAVVTDVIVNYTLSK